MKVGDAFLVPPKGETPEHLYVVTSDPARCAEDVLVVNVTTWRGTSGDDPACILNAGDHPFITHKSYMCYYRGKLVELAYLASEAQIGRFKIQTAMDAAVLRRIQQGVQDSVHAAEEHKTLMRKQGLAVLTPPTPPRTLRAHP